MVGEQLGISEGVAVGADEVGTFVGPEIGLLEGVSLGVLKLENTK